MILSTPPTVGTQLRGWRTRRQLSQLDLSMQADVSTRHLSYVETGRALPSRELILRLAGRLDVPLRERNRLLTAAGFAPMYRDRPLSDPSMTRARLAVDLLLHAHEPFPALAVDRHWNIVSRNRAVALLLEGVAPELLAPTANALRLSLHPAGMAARIVNYGPWREHVLTRLKQQYASSGDEALRALEVELAAFPVPEARTSGPHRDVSDAGVAVPLVLETSLGRLAFFSTTTIFGTPVDITLSELALESFLPADEATAAALRAAAEARSAPAAEGAQLDGS